MLPDMFYLYSQLPAFRGLKDQLSPTPVISILRQEARWINVSLYKFEHSPGPHSWGNAKCRKGFIWNNKKPPTEAPSVLNRDCGCWRLMLFPWDLRATNKPDYGSSVYPVSLECFEEKVWMTVIAIASQRLKQKPQIRFGKFFTKGSHKRGLKHNDVNVRQTTIHSRRFNYFSC